MHKKKGLRLTAFFPMKNGLMKKFFVLHRPEFILR